MKIKKFTIAIAESCSGGLIAHSLTNILGSSDYFDRGIVSYSNKSKIDLLDDEDTVKNKLNKAYCPEGDVEDNGVLAFVKHVIFNIKEDEFIIERPEKWGGTLKFKTYEEVEKAFAAKELASVDLKDALAAHIPARARGPDASSAAVAAPIDAPGTSEGPRASGRI